MTKDTTTPDWRPCTNCNAIDGPRLGRGNCMRCPRCGAQAETYDTTMPSDEELHKEIRKSGLYISWAERTDVARSEHDKWIDVVINIIDRHRAKALHEAEVRARIDQTKQLRFKLEGREREMLKTVGMGKEPPSSYWWDDIFVKVLITLTAEKEKKV